MLDNELLGGKCGPPRPYPMRIFAVTRCPGKWRRIVSHRGQKLVFLSRAQADAALSELMREAPDYGAEITELAEVGPEKVSEP